MSLVSYKFTKKELNDYYNPKVIAYRYMTNSINAIGFGQIVQKTSVTGNIIDTYYHIYDFATNSMVVFNPTLSQNVPSEEAGPTFWGVSSIDGLNFLNGLTTIPNLRKLKYCNNCSDANGLILPVISNFENRFTQLDSLVRTYNLLDGFLFYETNQPRYTNVFPSVKYDDGVNISYFFKTIDGTDKTLEQISEITGDAPAQIESSINTAPIFKPNAGVNSVITSCCDGYFHIIFGQYPQGMILFNGTLENSYCWYVESLTNEPVTIPPAFQFTSGGRSCQFCISTHGCPPICETVSLSFSTDINTVCSQPFINYFVAWNVGKIYNFEDCGGLSPDSGYYSDGRFIYSWDGSSIYDYGPCSTCVTRYFSFKPIPDFPSLCSGPTYAYEFDASTNMLYNQSSCNTTVAEVGYYAESQIIYYFDGITLSEYSMCR